MEGDLLGVFQNLEYSECQLDDAIFGDLGHEVYVSILEEFDGAGVIDELRPDLVDPALDLEGFTRREIGTETYYSNKVVRDELGNPVGSIHAPTKRPTRLLSIRTSVLDYLLCTGRGFHFDPEIIYDYEADYANLLRCVLWYVDEGDSFDLEVRCVDDADGSTVTIELRSDARSYRQSFGQERD